MRCVELETVIINGSKPFTWNSVSLNAQLDIENYSISYMVLVVETEANNVIRKEFDGKCFAQAASYYKDFVKKLQEKYRKV